MKRLLSLVLCLMLACSCVLAETADTLPKKFNRQLTGGNGIRGYVSITASGVAEWLNMLLPFTATDIQIRAIGEKQGEMSESINDDDDWQVRFYAKDSKEQEVGTTWLYGDPAGIYFQSELLPGTVLSVPMEQVHLLYELMRGDYADLFFAFDPLTLKEAEMQRNVPAYEAIANMLGIPTDEWEGKWMPVLEKYFLHLDLWLAGYGTTSVDNDANGALTMSANYQIPAADLKAQAKYVIGQMLYDNELMTLLLPYVTMEQRMTYLNPTMVYFYEACIDALPLEGDIILARETSARGEIVNAKVSLPIPSVPEKLAAPVNAAVSALFGLQDIDVLAGVKRIEFTQNGVEQGIAFFGDQYAFTVAADVTNPDENTTAYDGMIRIEPVQAGEAVAAAFTASTSHRYWQDEKYIDHDTTAVSFAVEMANDMLDAEDPLYGRCVDFKPVGVAFSVDYRNNPYQENSAVQINYDLELTLPDAAVQAEAVLRITTQMKLEKLTTTGAENMLDMTQERKDDLLQNFLINANALMQNLAGVPVEVVPAAEPEATAVPQMNE